MSERTDDRPVIDQLIGILSLDDNPGRLIAAHYVTTDADRERWLRELTELRHAVASIERKDRLLRRLEEQRDKQSARLVSAEKRVREIEAERGAARRIADVDEIEALPVGSILLEHIARHPGEAMAWRKECDGWWYPSTFSWVRQRGALAMAGVKPVLIHAPTATAPEPTFEEPGE